MQHPSYRSALAHALDDLVHWARMDNNLAVMGTEYQLIADVNRYRHRLGLPDVDAIDEVYASSAVKELADQEANAETVMHSVLTAIHDYQVRTHRPFADTIYLAPHNFDCIVAATKIITNPEMCDPDDPANYRYENPATCAREGTLFGCRVESSPEVAEGSFVLGTIHKVAP